MKSLEEIKEAAKTKLVGYTDRELDCFIQGALFMAGNIPQKRSEDWYKERDRRKERGRERSEKVNVLLQETTGLGVALDAIRNMKTEGEVIDNAFKVFFENVNSYLEVRQKMLELLNAEDRTAKEEIIEAVKMGCKAFNERHQDISLDFRELEENDGKWTFIWDEELKS